LHLKHVKISNDIYIYTRFCEDSLTK